MFAYRDRFTIWNRQNLKWATFRIGDLTIEPQSAGFVPDFKPGKSVSLWRSVGIGPLFPLNVDWVTHGVVLASQEGALFVDEMFRPTLLGGRFSSDPGVRSDVLQAQWAAQLGRPCAIDPKFRLNANRL
jgi:hypothetical protein